jgi:hypothetical protein
MQNSTYYTTSGLSSLPEYEGGGYLDQYGRQQYGLGKFVKKITKPIAKVLDKVVPNEIKPALPFIAAALPMFAPAFLSGIGKFLLPNALTAAGGAAAAGGSLSFLPGAIGGALTNVLTQSAQEGATKYGINPLSVGLSALGGALSTPGAASEFANMRPQMVDIDTGLLVAAKPQGILENIQSIGSTLAEKGATAFDKARSALEPEGAGVFSKDFLTAAAPGQIAAVGDLAYMNAQKALDEYDQQQAALGAMGVANTEGRKAAIKRAMGLAGYTEPEIESTILKFKFATGGRVGYQMGGGTKPPAMPMNPDMLSMAIFGKSYDELTYTQKSAINDMLPNKKAEGGIMNLGGMEMDLRAKGGFVPIGVKEKADDVPARLSKNEFVFTADAVRGAGKGDIKKGAKKMYQLMKQYEAIA